jgi:hypothetical protein
LSRPCGRARIRADAPCFILGNFRKDATVRLSHGRPRGHRPFENVRMTTLCPADTTEGDALQGRDSRWGVA